MSIDQNILAIWGASLSTMLGIIKIWEIWSARRVIEVSYSFNGIPEIGNAIIDSKSLR